MSSQRDMDQDPHHSDNELAADDALEEVHMDGDVPMDSDDDDDEGHHELDEELILHNDSVAYFDAHRDSVFAIAQHPLHPALVATGGSEGEADDAPGKGYVVDTSAAPSRPLLPASYAAEPGMVERPSLPHVFEIDGHTDSISALAFTLPKGEVLLSGGMDGRLAAYGVNIDNAGCKFTPLAEAREVSEVTWLHACPSPAHPNSFALGAADGSVWVYTVDPAEGDNALGIVRTYFLHTGACTAGAWTPDGAFLVTVSEDTTLYVWDVWGQLSSGDNALVSLTGADQRFAVEGGLYSVAVEPKGTYAAVGGAGGAIRIVSLPRAPASSTGGTAAKNKKQKGKGAPAEATGGQILASLQTQSETIETLSFSTPSPAQAGGAGITLLAAGSVDGSVAVFDASRRFAVRRHIPSAHEDQAVVQVEFVKGEWLLTSCGMDGVVRRWDLKAGAGAGPTATATAGPAGAAVGLVKEWRGHRGGGEGGGVLGFVQGETGERVVTAGDDSVVLVFEA